MPDTTFHAVDPKEFKGRDLVQADPELPRQTFRGPIEDVHVTDTEVVFTMGWVAWQGKDGLRWVILPQPPYKVTTMRNIPVIQVDEVVQFRSGLLSNRILAPGDNLAKA